LFQPGVWFGLASTWVRCVQVAAMTLYRTRLAFVWEYVLLRMAQVAPGGDIATVRDDGRLPGDGEHGFSGAFTGLLVAGQPVRARFCGVCQLWFGSAKDQFMDPVRARQKHCRDDPGHVSTPELLPSPSNADEAAVTPAASRLGDFD